MDIRYSGLSGRRFPLTLTLSLRGEGTAAARRGFCGHWLGEIRREYTQSRATILPLPKGPKGEARVRGKKTSPTQRSHE